LKAARRQSASLGIMRLERMPRSNAMVAYAAVYAAVALVLTAILFERRDL
jgi:hypothetical protein